MTISYRGGLIQVAWAAGEVGGSCLEGNRFPSNDRKSNDLNESIRAFIKQRQSRTWPPEPMKSDPNPALQSATAHCCQQDASAAPWLVSARGEKGDCREADRAAWLDSASP